MEYESEPDLVKYEPEHDLVEYEPEPELVEYEPEPDPMKCEEGVCWNYWLKAHKLSEHEGVRFSCD